MTCLMPNPNYRTFPYEENTFSFAIASASRCWPSGGTANPEKIACPIATVIISTPALENRESTSTEKLKDDLDRDTQSIEPCCVKLALAG
jgi:hypothetical protein